MNNKKNNPFVNCRSWLFSPASNPKLLYSAVVYKPDAIIFDLEDAVALKEKEDARELLIEALKSINYGTIPIFARVNSIKTPFGFDDIKYLVQAGLKHIRLPMCDTPEEIKEVDKFLTKVEEENGIPKGTVVIAAALETPIGVYNAYNIATASDRVIGISLGAEDFTRCMGIERTKEEEELAYARGKIVMEAHAAGVACVDGVYTKIDDMEGFQIQCEKSRSLGFTGKACIHPAQIPYLHKAYLPKKEDIDYSLEVLEAASKTDISNGGVISLNGKMIDIPIIEKAEKIVALAKSAGMIK
ncbi:HpcH/HpaI aldolase/citrate lyase family protein [Brachyspira hampsonii]|uniref:Citrate lyase subunit beta n=1 Tax=Brachyspira hampsonii TaxID=1287055 RepID=A0AAC9TWG3_9SPIR|nr:aldolase/citrate lyase family protein [Brachyspira hampsonii]ASJ21786.1 citrate lyase subunit beta [Brachyspira hampsonii]ELV05071.1 citrate (pro-3S)-lyase subunit beta [Brachyspira hampsonii 30599]MBW5380118.1 citrate lyase subunit beta [Brachyspira hampsonii]MBW5409088.1 citrate lyase subunit beta [Brachyspira hampsonii]OEJ17363.1 citrate lyase subunit beta [Brachyspira hampsonii]